MNIDFQDMPTPELKVQWKRFKASEPGHRFQDRYESRRESRKGRFNAFRVLKILAGAALVPLGLLMVPAPGPGWLVVFLGLALLSDEVGPVARGLDWAELKARGLLGRLRRRPGRHPRTT